MATSPTSTARPPPATPTANRLTATGVGNGVSRCSTTSTSRTHAENSAIRLDQRASGATIIVARSFMAFLARPAETIRSYQASRGLTSARPSGADGIARGRPRDCCSNDAEKFGSQVLSACIPGRSARWGAQSRGLPRDGAGQGPGLPPLKRRHPGMQPLYSAGAGWAAGGAAGRACASGASIIRPQANSTPATIR